MGDVYQICVKVFPELFNFLLDSTNVFARACLEIELELESGRMWHLSGMDSSFSK